MIHQDIASLSKPITSFLPDPDNARKHDPKNLAAIKASLSKFGQRKPIVCQQTDSGLIVRAGNGTLEAAKELGWSDLAAVVITEDNVTATGYAIADNRTAELADWDLGVLDETLFSLASEGVDLLDLGFSEEDLAKILPKEIEAVEGEDDVPEVVETVCKPGDLWILGEHRLLCGDSTDVLQVERLMDGQKADMVCGKNVLDLFLGSGSTIIACEKTSRKCYGMEIDPHYCDVIIARWEKFTGKKATLEVANA